MKAATPLIEVLRADVHESEHAGSIAVVDSSGQLIAFCGDIERDIFTRSSLKPFQAAPFVAMGGLEQRGWGLPQLALMCASHSGESQHVGLARSMLADCGLEHRHLLCGCQVPIAYTQSGRLPKADEVFSELHNNCSGKHSGFLAACLHQGEPIDDYVAMGHPLQRRIRDSLAKALCRDQAFKLGVDGCAAPNLAMPLPQLAQLFAVMAAEHSPEPFARVYGDWVFKAGAEAVQAIGVRSRGLGVAIKIADGNAQAMTWIVVEIFRQLGIGDNEQKKQLQELVDRPIRNVRGDAVGSYRPVFKLKMLTGE